MTMTTQSSHERRMRILEWKNQLQRNTYLGFLQKVPARLARPTESERNLVMTSFILGILSIITGFFPIAGFPIALAGLAMGIAGRRVVALRNIASWGVWLSLVGLVVTLVTTVVIITLYLSSYIFQ
ncbi:MAG TPA: hypothetical protein VKR06_12215 [Ktedonosporobacter sp.]|nr:hypothetical protein [Ktedonosporobacter sp.]